MRTGSGQTSLGNGDGSGWRWRTARRRRARRHGAIARSVMARSMSSCAVSYRGGAVARLPFGVWRQVGYFDRCRLWAHRPPRPAGCRRFPDRTGSAPATRSLPCAIAAARLRSVLVGCAAPRARPEARCPCGAVSARAWRAGPTARRVFRHRGPSAPPRAAPSGRQSASGGPGFRRRGGPARRGPPARRLTAPSMFSTLGLPRARRC
jgi:hypothetical protein